MKPDCSVLPVVSLYLRHIYIRHCFVVTIVRSEDNLIEGIVHFFSGDDLAFERAEFEHEVDELAHGSLAHCEDGVLHHEVDQRQELLELAELVGLLRGLMNVEPALTDIFERGLDDIGEATDPTLFSCSVSNLTNAC